VEYINRQVSDYGEVYIADANEIKAMVDLLNTVSRAMPE
jgi:hypothetical protein